MERNISMQFTAEQVKILQQVALDTILNEAQTTRRVMEAIPADQSHYKPDPISMNARDLAIHIAVSELHFLRSIRQGKFDYKYTLPEGLKTPEQIAEWYAKEVEKSVGELRALPPEQMSKIIEFLDVLQWPAVLYLNMAIHHSIHHRGQLSSYIRPMGGKVPSIYGPSYEDEKHEKGAN
jgi:uncharacterized damage-inducible protein DinB